MWSQEALTVPATVVRSSACDARTTETPKSPILATPRSGGELDALAEAEEDAEIAEEAGRLEEMSRLLGLMSKREKTKVRNVVKQRMCIYTTTSPYNERIAPR